MLSRLVTDEEAKDAHAFILGIQRGDISTVEKGLGLRLRAAEDIVRAWQTQQRYEPAKITELAKKPLASADLRDYANMTDEDLNAKVVAIRGGRTA